MNKCLRVCYSEAGNLHVVSNMDVCMPTLIARFMGPTWGPSGTDRTQVGPMLTPWASYQIRKIADCACAGNAGNVFPRRRFQRKPLVSYPGMHHGTCVTHVPWCMSGSLTCGDGENVPSIPGAFAPAILHIWQEAHEPCYLGKSKDRSITGILSHGSKQYIDTACLHTLGDYWS